MANTPAATPTFENVGPLFNDATRFLEGGLWQNVVGALQQRPNAHSPLSRHGGPLRLNVPRVRPIWPTRREGLH